MKKTFILSLFLGLLCFTAVAQSTYRQGTDAAFVNLDKSGITTGILYSRVFAYAALDTYQSSDTLSFGLFKQAFSELYPLLD